MEQKLIPTLQAAIGPVILISGVGLLILSMTNRLGRVIDRARDLIKLTRAAPPRERDRWIAELRILSRRARSVRLAIALAAVSILMTAFLVIAVFIGALLQAPTAVIVAALFITCLVSLIGSIIFFLHDINLSLAALKIELASVDQGASETV